MKKIDKVCLTRKCCLRKSFLAQHPETVENVLRALVDAIVFIQKPDNKTAVPEDLGAMCSGTLLTSWNSTETWELDLKC